MVNDLPLMVNDLALMVNDLALMVNKHFWASWLLKTSTCSDQVNTTVEDVYIVLEDDKFFSYIIFVMVVY